MRAYSPVPVEIPRDAREVAESCANLDQGPLPRSLSTEVLGGLERQEGFPCCTNLLQGLPRGAVDALQGRGCTNLLQGLPRGAVDALQGRDYVKALLEDANAKGMSRRLLI